MIKINLTQKKKREIETAHFKDLEKHGLTTHLLDWMRLFPEIGKYFNRPGYYSEKVRNIILGDREQLREIISIIGIVSSSNHSYYKKAYSNFSNRKWAYNLLKVLNVSVCPYCNRQYTFTLDKDDGIRPQFDHYYPLSKYPYLQTSLYNLIPSCNICNLKKSDLDTYQEEIFYPYEEEFGFNVNFTLQNFDTKSIIGLNTNFSIKIEHIDSSMQEKVDLIIESFQLEKLYNKHKDYAQDAVRNSIMYNDSHIEELYKDFGSCFDSKEELRNIVHMNYLNKEKWGQRPLAKFTHDIHQSVQVKK